MYLQRCFAAGLMAAAVAGTPAASAALPTGRDFQNIYTGHHWMAALGTPAPSRLVASGPDPDAPAGPPHATGTDAGTPGTARPNAGAGADDDNSIAGFGPAAAPGTLERTRGGEGGIVSDTRLGGTVSGNSATHVVTGTNIIQSGSFANATGVPIVIQNSGANVLIQNATVINLQLK